MNVTIEKCGDELIAALAGEIDHHNSKQIREAIDAELERGGYKLLTFDPESGSCSADIRSCLKGAGG